MTKMNHTQEQAALNKLKQAAEHYAKGGDRKKAKDCCAFILSLTNEIDHQSWCAEFFGKLGYPSKSKALWTSLLELAESKKSAIGIGMCAAGLGDFLKAEAAYRNYATQMRRISQFEEANEAELAADQCKTLFQDQLRKEMRRKK